MKNNLAMNNPVKYHFKLTQQLSHFLQVNNHEIRENIHHIIRQKILLDIIRKYSQKKFPIFDPFPKKTFTATKCLLADQHVLSSSNQNTTVYYLSYIPSQTHQENTSGRTSSKSYISVRIAKKFLASEHQHKLLVHISKQKEHKKACCIIERLLYALKNFRAKYEMKKVQPTTISSSSSLASSTPATSANVIVSPCSDDFVPAEVPDLRFLIWPGECCTSNSIPQKPVLKCLKKNWIRRPVKIENE